MNELTQLSFLRKHYLELTKLFFHEIQKGKQLHELTELKNQIHATLLEINLLEKELNINKDE